MARIKTNGSKDTSANLGFEAKLWHACGQAAQQHGRGGI
jgi:hypothetical protein